MKNTENLITVRHLQKTYGKVRAVEDISFEVHDGEIFGIIGPNGAGKTTTVECLIGLRDADGGEVRVLGMDPRRQAREIRQRIGVQLQQASLPEDMKVWEALDLFSAFYSHTLNWRNLLEEWGLSEKRNSRFASLSGGQKQRLFIALSLVNDPELVFLDELTTGLDPQARRNTWDLIRKMQREGKTILLVTHFMEEAETLCDRVAIIDQGRLIALDTPQNLIRQVDGKTCLRFTLPHRMDVTWLSALPEVSSFQQNDLEVVMTGDSTLLVVAASSLAERGILPSDFRTERTTLEDVFLALTGRKIRE